jgi:hypothetical protein
MSAGAALRRALESWTDGIAPVGVLLLRRNSNGRLLPVAVHAKPHWLTVGWYSGSAPTPDVVEFPDSTNLLRPNDPDWHPLRGAQWNDDPGWAWRWGLEMVRDELSEVLSMRALRVECSELIDEALWLATLVAGRKGSLWSRPIPIEEVASLLVAALKATPVLLLKDRVAPSDLMLQRLTDLRGRGVTHIEPPWPSPDIRHDDGRRLDTYTPEQRILRVNEIFSAALRVYEEITTTWFPTLRSRMVTAVTLPAHLIGNFSPQAPSGVDMPILDWYLEPLPDGSTSQVTISLGREPRTDRWADIQERFQRLRELRPEAADWLVTTHHSGIAHVFQPAPLAELVYGWIISDLKRIKWAK